MNGQERQPRQPLQDNAGLSQQQMTQYGAYPPQNPVPASVRAPLVISPSQQHTGTQVSKRTTVFVVFLVAVLVLGAILGPILLRKMNNLASGKGWPNQETALSHPSPTSIPTPMPTPLSTHDKYKLLATQYVSRMSLDEELGQLIMVQYAGRIYSYDLDNMINQQHVGGIIMYEDRRTNQQQLRFFSQAKADIARMQQRARTPLFIGIDEEGGFVNRLGDIFSVSKSADAIHQSNDPNVADSEGHQVAKEMQELGINLNFAPDVDVSVQQNGYLDNDNRTFGYTSDDVIKYAGAYMHAQQSDGIVDCIKHFPGIGSVLVGFDPHVVLPTVSKSQQELDSVDLVPFKHFIEATDPNDQPGMIMSTDVLVPSLDPTYPAEFSHVIMTDLLRKKLGYDRVIISDSVIMGGVEVNGVQLNQAQASLLAIQAGVDMVLDVDGPTNVAAVIATFKDALQKGTLSRDRVDEAVTHIITLKMERKILPATIS